MPTVLKVKTTKLKKKLENKKNLLELGRTWLVCRKQSPNPKTHHQIPMTRFRHFQNCCNKDRNTIFKYMNYISIFLATVLEVPLSVLKNGVSQYFCPYSVCTSHWCLVMSFWLKVCIYSHTRGVKLGLGLGFMQTSQVLPHWLNQSFLLNLALYTEALSC